MGNFIVSEKGKDKLYRIWHTPEGNMFIFIESGEGSIVLQERNYPIESGVLCFIGKNKYHYTFPNQPSEYVRSKLFVKSDALEQLTKALGLDFHRTFHRDAAAFAVLSGEDYNRVSGIFRNLKGLPADAKYMQAEIYCAAVQLMVILAGHATAEPNIKPDPLQQAINYINRHISESISLSEISRMCYISKYHLCRTFKEKTGVTVMEYILQTRIILAQELLQKGELSVTQISNACGFSSPSYFSRIFKEKTGISPVRYRNSRL